MLDTIAITLDGKDFQIHAPERFSPSAVGLIRPPYYRLGSRGAFNCVLNPTKAELKAGRYAPRLTLTKRQVAKAGLAMTLRIEFSAPKLIFGNNFDELTKVDFARVLAAVHQALGDVGVEVSEAVLRAAPISAIHYSKNMAFTDYTNCSMIMSELARIDLNQRLDLSRTEYRNGGHVVRYHANSFEVVFYDKLKDLEKARFSEKRAIERDNASQLEMLSLRGRFPKQLEVLRMEARLGTRKKIRDVLARINSNAEPTFECLFDDRLAKAVLLHFWESVRVQIPLLDLCRRRPEDILGGLARSAGAAAQPGKLLQQLGAIWLTGSIGFLGARAALSRCGSPRSWQRYKKALKDEIVPDKALFSPLARVSEALAKFQPVRLADFQTAPTQSSIARGESTAGRVHQAGLPDRAAESNA